MYLSAPRHPLSGDGMAAARIPTHRNDTSDIDCSDVNKTTKFKTDTKPRPIKTKTVADKTFIKTQIIAPAMAINRWQTGNYTHK